MSCLADAAFWSAVRAAASSSLAATLAAFAMILVLTRLKVPLAASVLAGAGALGALFGLRGGGVASMCLAGAVRPQTLGLVVVVILMLVLSEAMRRAGQLDRMVELARAFLRRPAVTMAALPALIGLMPMPGGAHLSAPMVEAAAGGAEVSRERLSAINYWFRHIWEHWWPLYPGVIVATAMTRSGPGEFALYQVPLGVLMAASGLLIFRGSHGDLHRTGPRPPAGQVRRLLKATSTIWVILLVWGAVRAALVWALGAEPDGRWAAAAGRYGPLAAGLAVSLAWTIRLNRLGAAEMLAVLKRPSIYKLSLVVVAVMIFWHAIRHVDAARQIAAELAALRVPAEIVVALLPLIAGLVTGLAVGFVGTSFPIVLAVVAAMPAGGSIRPYVALAYGFGHLGQMLSPLHVCQVMSNEYFGAASRGVYRRLAPTIALMAAATVAYAMALRWLLR